jgi:hypothetical protein
MYIKIINYLLLSTLILKANITGTVFEDLPVKNSNLILELNQYGVQDSNERGVSGVKVMAYPEQLSTTTDENGSWSLAISVDSRIEYSNIPFYLQESPNSSSIQFVTPNTSGLSFALHNPKDYVNTPNPFYTNNLQQNGSHLGSTFQALQTVPYNAQGLNSDFSTFIDNIPGTGINASDETVMEQLGSVWGKAYQKNKKRLFIASMLQRHIGFANTPADIYVVDYADYLTGDSSSPKLIGHFSLQGKVLSNGGVAIDLGVVDRTSGSDYTLTNNPLAPNIDLDAYAKVGKIAYGGIDIDYSSNTLWAVNLNQKGLISMDVSGNMNDFASAKTNQYLIEELKNVPTCTNGELRPWALKIHEAKGYLGLICDASLSKSQDDLAAHIVSFNIQKPQDGFQNELTFPLNYIRQVDGWHPWEDVRVDLNKTKFGTVYDEPILSDIEFDENDNMYIAFLDRYATKLGNLNYGASSGESKADERAVSYGELLKICNNQGVYEREGTGNCLKQDYQNSKNSAINEFFNDIGGGNEFEPALGALALLKGSQQLLSTTLDPHPENIPVDGSRRYWNTQGVHTYSTVTGSIENWYAHAMTSGQGLNSKANGIGDIELISDPAPLEIGDRVWLDRNPNGVQDANESGIANVQVDLVCNGNVVATSITNSEGNYLFSNDISNTVVSTASHRYAVSELKENSNECFVSIPNIIGTNKQDSLTAYVLTDPKRGEGNSSILNDSNANLNAKSAKVEITALDIPVSGANNHSFDIGFKLESNTTEVLYRLGDRVWLDTNKNGIQESNESGVPNITVTLYNTGNCTGSSIATEITNGSGNYLFTDLSSGIYSLSFSNLPSDHNITVSNQGSDDGLNSDANVDGCIPNISLTSDNLEEDVGIIAITQEVVVVPPPTIKTIEIGNRVWVEDDNDGDARTGVITPIVGIIVTALSSDGTRYTAITDSTGHYVISVPGNDTYIVTVETPENYEPTKNSSDNSIMDTMSEDNFSHDGNGTKVSVTDTNNYSVDFGFIRSSTTTTTTRTLITCDELISNDDVQNANPTQATTTLDVLQNDRGIENNTQTIKFLSLEEGEDLWNNEGTPIGSPNTMDVLVIPEEGTWKVEDNKVIFTALDSFDGQIPTPVYYILEGSSDCTIETRYSNVGQIVIDTPCTCPQYKIKSVSIHNVIMIFLLMLLTFGISFKRVEELQS